MKCYLDAGCDAKVGEIKCRQNPVTYDFQGGL